MDSPQRKKTNKIKIVSNYDGILPTNEHLEEEKCDKVHYDEISAARYEVSRNFPLKKSNLKLSRLTPKAKSKTEYLESIRIKSTIRFQKARGISWKTS